MLTRTSLGTSPIGNVSVAAGRFRDLTSNDLWWPRNDLQHFCHRMFNTCTKFHLDTTMLSYLTFTDLWWPWNDVQHFRHLMFTIRTKFRLDTTMLMIWPLMTSDDLEMTFNTFATLYLLHVPSFVWIRHCLVIWPVMTPDDLGMTSNIFAA